MKCSQCLVASSKGLKVSDTLILQQQRISSHWLSQINHNSHSFWKHRRPSTSAFRPLICDRIDRGHKHDPTICFKPVKVMRTGLTLTQSEAKLCCIGRSIWSPKCWKLFGSIKPRDSRMQTIIRHQSTTLLISKMPKMMSIQNKETLLSKILKVLQPLSLFRTKKSTTNCAWPSNALISFFCVILVCYNFQVSKYG